MPSLRKMFPVAQVFPLREIKNIASRSAPGAKFYFEDGWVFREQHGKHIECICRYEAAQTGSPSQSDTAHFAASGRQ